MRTVRRIRFCLSSLAVLFVALLQLACNTTINGKESAEVNEIPNHLATLNWVHAANAKQDVKVSADKQDYRLFILAGRGEHMPGVQPDKASESKQRCGMRYLQGSTDLVRDDQHSQLLQKAYRYAEDYNQLMLQHFCKER